MTNAARKLDRFLWTLIFGDGGHMQLRPPLGMRARIVSRFPVHLISPDRPTRPVFIVGCPRSGTTLLFNILSLSPSLGSLGQESHWIWEYMHPPEKSPTYSQAMRPVDVSPVIRRYVLACYGAAFGRKRFVDKSPANSLRVGAIREIYPDGQIVFITRNAPDNISSLIDTWRLNRFKGFDVPERVELDGYDEQRWKHVLPPGWQRYAQSSIEEVCTHQWISTNRHLAEASRRLPANDFVQVRYEDLFSAPERTIADLSARIDVDVGSEMEEFVSSLHDNVVNTTSKPKIGKWKTRNPDRVRRMLPRTEDIMTRLGYDLNEYL